MKATLFNLKAMQNKGMANTGHIVDYIVGALVAVLLIAVISPTIFSYLGTGNGGLGNTTSNPSVPTWLSPVLIIFAGIGLLYLFGRGIGLIK